MGLALVPQEDRHVIGGERRSHNKVAQVRVDNLVLVGGAIGGLVVLMEDANMDMVLGHASLMANMVTSQQ